jgi:hypothetical protein
MTEPSEPGTSTIAQGSFSFTDDEFRRGIQDEIGIKPEWAGRRELHGRR